MTPPKVQSEGFYNYTAGVCEAPEQISRLSETSGPVCSTAQLSPVRLLQIDLSTRFASLQRNHVVARDSKQMLASAAQGTQAESKSQFNPLEILAALIPVGCTNSGDLTEAPADEPALPPTENPDPIPGEHDGVGGVDGNFAGSECADPAAMFKSYADNKLLMVCGDTQAPGAGLIEAVDPSSGSVSSITIPGVVDGDETRPVTLSAGASHEGTQLVFAGLTPAGSEEDFQSKPFIYRNSGIYTVEADGANPQWTPFKTLVKIQVDGNADTIPLMSPEDGANAGVTVSIDPNTPVSMTVAGDTLYSLNMNLSNDQNGAFTKSLAPATIHAFSIGQDGLTEKPFGAQRLQANGVDSVGHALVLDGHYVPAAIADVGDGRLAVLIRGVAHPDNASRIILLEIEDPSVQTQIDLSDSAGLNMWAGDSNQLPIVTLNNIPHALVGAGDETGRVALVNLDTGVVHYVGVFGDGHNVVSIVVDEAGSQAIAVSEQGKAISINLTEIDGLSGLPMVGAAHDLPADARVAALRGNSLVVAHPNKYSKVDVAPAPSGE
jgi:hypothetical protein